MGGRKQSYSYRNLVPIVRRPNTSIYAFTATAGEPEYGCTGNLL